MHFSLEQLLNFKENKYELARACMEYAKKVRYLQPDEYHMTGEKDALVALRSVLDKQIHYTFEVVNRDEIDLFADFDQMPRREEVPIDLGHEDEDEAETPAEKA